MAEPSTQSPGRTILSVFLNLGFLTSLFITSGGFIVLIFSLQHLNVLPAPESSFWNVIFPIHRSSEHLFPKDEHTGHFDLYRLPFMQAVTPFFLIAALMEYLVMVAKGIHKTHYQLDDSINSLSLGTMSEVWSKVFRAFWVYPYLWVHNNFRLVDVDPYSPAAWWLLFLGQDFCYYWFHRLSHERNLFWATHKVHHSSERYNLTTALRQASFGGITGWIFYVPLALFFPLKMQSLHAIFCLLYQFWIHTALVNKLPAPFEFVFNTPSHHRVHHARNPAYIDTNYGATLILWDRLFGTFKAEGETVVYGLVPPQRTWDPLYDNYKHWLHMLQQARLSDSLLSALRVPFRGPGWFVVKGVGKYLPVAPLGSKFNPLGTFDNGLSSRIRVYTFIQFLVISIAFVTSELLQTTLYATLPFFTVSLFALGGLLNRRSWAFLFEVFRLISTAALMFIFLPASAFVLLYSSIAFTVLSLAFLLATSKDIVETSAQKKSD
eukprot:GILI01002451.1.p1 GENE.GILI01002451.1~~GILI01002451.1.p1  ORF type:complete len:492 (+),score=116.44 GILI01002451.1:59-1534(+)